MSRLAHVSLGLLVAFIATFSTIGSGAAKATPPGMSGVVTISSLYVAATPPAEDGGCIDCNTNGCMEPPSGYLIGHWDDTTATRKEWTQGPGGFHGGCFYNEQGEGGSVCNPHQPCLTDEELLLEAVLDAIDGNDLVTVTRALAQSKTLSLNHERRSIQGTSCDGKAVVRNIALEERFAAQLFAASQ